MAALTPQTIKGPFAIITANSADFTFAAGATGAGDTFACTGRELLIAYNSSVDTAYKLTITSVADEKNRTGDISEYSMSAGEYAAFGVGLTNEAGWKSSNGTIAVSVENAAIKWAVLRLPEGYPR
jgi:hypothetical protein